MYEWKTAAQPELPAAVSTHLIYRGMPRENSIKVQSDKVLVHVLKADEFCFVQGFFVFRGHYHLLFKRLLFSDIEMSIERKWTV